MFLADDDVLHREAIVFNFRNSRADLNCVWVSERDSETATGGGEDRSDAGLLHVLEYVQLLEIGDSATFKESKISGVVEVAKSIHLSPRNRGFDDYWIVLEQVFHRYAELNRSSSDCFQVTLCVCVS